VSVGDGRCELPTARGRGEVGAGLLGGGAALGAIVACAWAHDGSEVDGLGGRERVAVHAMHEEDRRTRRGWCARGRSSGLVRSIPRTEMAWDRHANHYGNAHHHWLRSDDLVECIFEELLAHKGAGDGRVVVDHAAVRCQYIVKRMEEEMD